MFILIFFLVLLLSPKCGQAQAVGIIGADTPVNYPPLAGPQEVTTTENIPKSIVLTGEDANGNTFTFIIVDPPLNGSLGSFDPLAGLLTYSPAAGFSGADSFTFQVNDGIADSEPVTVTITVIPGSKSITIIKMGSGSGTVTSSPAGINCGSTCSASFDSGTIVTLTATQAAGSFFAGWSGGGCSGTGACIFNITADTTVTVTFNASSQTFTLQTTIAGSASGTVTSSPAGINCGPDCSEVYAINTNVTLTASAGSGASFKEWGGACSGTSTTCTVTMSADRSVTAKFSKTFTDDPLTAQATQAKATHITELRDAINTLRSRNSLASFSFTDATLTASSTQIKAVHITELRTALNSVYDTKGLALPSYTDSTITAGQTTIKKAHIAEIRSAVKNAE